MLLTPSSRAGRAYSLVELLVVIGVITVVGLTSIPNIFNRNDRLSLANSASTIRQMIIDARTRSLAPDKNDSSGSSQQYQVVFGNFSQAAVQSEVAVKGDINSNRVSLEKGLAQCDNVDVQGGFTTLRSTTLPRGIYISKFYPSNQPITDDQSVVRFTVGKEGFLCGGADAPTFSSSAASGGGWQGKNGSGANTVSRYMVIELSSSKIGEKRYVALDRVTGEVIISRTNPQSYFVATADLYAPKWTNVDSANFLLSISCGYLSSTVTITYPRANDLVDESASNGDPNLFVAYDISWNTGSGEQPLAIKYFYDLNGDPVRYTFTTDTFTITNQPSTVTVKVAASDASGRVQPASDPDERMRQRSKNFSPSCGRIPGEIEGQNPAENPTLQVDPGGLSQTCNPIGKSQSGIFERLARLIIPSAKALPPTELEIC